METINNMANAAAKVVWGDGDSTAAKQEPVSGVQGDTSKGEPFDAGNTDSAKHADPIPHDESKSTTGTSAPTETSHTTGGQSDTPKPSEPTETSDTTSGQNDTRKPSDPNTNPEEAKQEISSGDNLKQPGPQPLERVAKEHGGDAGNNNPQGDSKEDSNSSEESDEEEGGLQKHSHGSGTGEQWVKSSGMKADGGDFDAAAPGAGKEADRLLEKKGVKREIPQNKSDDKLDSGVKGEELTAKPSLGDKIKAKLHSH